MAERTIHARPNLAHSGSIMQRNALRTAQLAIDDTTLIAVRCGHKILRAADDEKTVYPQHIMSVDGGLQVDVLNHPDPETKLYHADWLVLTPALLHRFADWQADVKKRQAEIQICANDAGLDTLFRQACAAVANHQLSDKMAELQLFALLQSLAERGVNLNIGREDHLLRQLRRLLASDPSQAWTAESASARCHISSATLRRRLAASGLSFRHILIEVRMLRALTLLQATEWPVSRIAYACGYESPSRFSVRFRQRFGFAPSAIRQGQTV